jgi:hypothetical protein
VSRTSKLALPQPEWRSQPACTRSSTYTEYRRRLCMFFPCTRVSTCVLCLLHSGVCCAWISQQWAGLAIDVTQLLVGACALFYTTRKLTR